MAIKVQQVSKRDLSKVLVIVRGDDAVDWDNPATDYEAYKRDGDEAHLAFLPDQQPTRFVCNFDLPAEHTRKLKNHMLSGRDTEGKPTFAYGDWAHDVVRRTLKDVQQPDSLKPEERIHYKKDKDSLVHPDTMKVLERLGITDAILGWYTDLVLTGPRAEAKN